MHNCLILGSGRSGTSMVAGSLASSGYYMGDQLIPPTPSNPKGFFEDREINSINELLLEPVVPRRPPLIGRWFFQDRPRRGANWLARVPVGVKIQCPTFIADRIQNAVSHEPYCFKDPRFSYTLPAWRPYLQNAVFVCVFRDPGATAASILKESKEPKYARKVLLQYKHAIRLWLLLYTHIVEVHRHEGEWMFIHYDQIVGGDGVHRLESFLETRVDRSFPDSALRRSASNINIGRKTLSLYKKLCKLAGYKG